MPWNQSRKNTLSIWNVLQGGEEPNKGLASEEAPLSEASGHGTWNLSPSHRRGCSVLPPG